MNLQGLDLRDKTDVLDLGCGYGFFIEKLKGRLSPRVLVTGIDLVEENREAFLHSVGATGYKGAFIQGTADAIKEMESDRITALHATLSFTRIPCPWRRVSY